MQVYPMHWIDNDHATGTSKDPSFPCLVPLLVWNHSSAVLLLMAAFAFCLHLSVIQEVCFCFIFILFFVHAMVASYSSSLHYHWQSHLYRPPLYGTDSDMPIH